MNLETILDDINLIIVKLDTIIKQKNKNGDYFINSLCEDIFIEMFNEIFKCKLKNLNYYKPNAPAIDLFDTSSDKKIVIQITSDNKPKKLYDTISKFDNNIDNYGDYKELYLFILTKKSSSYNAKEVSQRLVKKSGFNFNINTHIIDIYSLTNLLKKSFHDGSNLTSLINIKENLEQAINGVEFKYKELKLSDKNSFNKTNYNFKDQELKLERTLVDNSNQIINIKDLLIDESIQYILIKSDAGFGKSHLLNDSFNFLYEDAVNSYNYITPYIMNLKEFNNLKDFKENISVIYFEKRKRPLLILDGLDEITDEEEQKNIENKLVCYLNNYKNVNCLISSRHDFKKIKTYENTDEKIIFKEYFLTKLSEDQIESYLKSKKILKEFTSHSNYQSIKKSLQIPFNLYNVCQYFLKNKKLSDSIIYINHKRIDEDIKKYSKNNEMLLLKTRIFLEKFAVINNLVEKKIFSKKEVGNLIDFEEDIYKILKKINLLYFDEIDENIRFNNNHKYFEDILVTYFFKEKKLDNVLEIFSIRENEYLVPKSWYNSLSMLVSLSDIESKFSKKIIENHQYILIGSEDIGLNEMQKNKIFQKIFNIYEEKDIWIDQQKFDLNKLTQFGDTLENFNFLISKINSNNQRTKSKAISLLRKFIPSQKRTDILIPVLCDEINKDNNKNIIWEIYYCLSKYKDYIDINLQKKIINLSSKSEFEFLKNNEYVRAGVYHFINVCNLEEDYTDYMIEGLTLLKKSVSRNDLIEGRSEISLMDEGINLDNLFYKIKSKKKIIEVYEILFNNYSAYNNYHTDNILERLISNSKDIIYTNKNNKHFINAFINIFSKYDELNDNWFYWKEIVINFKLDKFIIETLKAEKEVLEKLINKKKIFNNHFLVSVDGISKLVTENSYHLIIESVDKKLISIEDAVRIFEFIDNRDEKLSKKLKPEIIKRGGSINNNIKIENDNLKEEQIKNFELLFNEDNFKKEVLSFFKKSNTIELTWVEIPEWYNDNLYFNNDVRIEFLRTYFNKKSIDKSEVLKEFRNGIKDNLIETILNKKIQFKYDFSENQAIILESWLKKRISKLDFRNAIHNVENNSFSINQDCNTIYKYIQELDINLDKKTNLDLLSFIDINRTFENYNSEYESYFEILIEKIGDIDAVKRRVYENLENKIKYSASLNNHIIFSYKHNIIENYKLIEDLLTEILPELQNGHYHDNPLIVYYDKSKNFEFIKKNFPSITTDLFWIIIDYLIVNNENLEFVEEKLLLNIEKTEDYNEKLKFASKLLKINSKDALSRFYLILKHIKVKQLEGEYRLYAFKESINEYKNLEIKAAVNLLELTFKFYFDNFDNPIREVSTYLKRMIIENKDNYDEIKKLITSVIESNTGIIDNIQFLEYELNDYRETFYSNYKSNYSLKDALKIISEID